MRVFVTSLAFVAAVALPAVAESRHNSVEEQLHKRSDALQAAEHKLDAEAAALFYADDAVIQPAGSPAVVGRQAIGDLYHYFFEKLAPKELAGTPTTLAVSKSGDLAYETGVNRIVFGSADGDLLDMGKYLLVWKRIDGEWYVAALSFTSDAPAPVPQAKK